MRRIVFLFIWLSWTQQISAQSVSEALDTYLLSVRTGSFKPAPNDLLNTNQEEMLLAALPKYHSDSLAKIRSKAYHITKVVGQRSTKSRIVRTAIGQLVDGLKDVDSGISGNNIEALTGFDKNAFTKQHMQQILSHIAPEVAHLDILLKLTGYLEIAGARAKLFQIINSEVSFRIRWTARLALARMGDQEAVEYLLGKLEKAPIDDNFMYDFAPDLVYTRQEAIFEFLEDIVQSNDNNCYSPDPDSNRKILCGYRAMEYLAVAIEGYPLPVDEFGALEVDDYQESLETLRSWLDQNESYGISKDTF